MARLSKKKTQPRKVISKKRPRRKTNKKTMKKGYGKKMNKKTMKGGGARGVLIDDIIGLGFKNLDKKKLRSITGCEEKKILGKTPDKKRCKNFLTELNKFLVEIQELDFKNSQTDYGSNESIEDIITFDKLNNINIDDLIYVNNNSGMIPDPFEIPNESLQKDRDSIIGVFDKYTIDISVLIKIIKEEIEKEAKKGGESVNSLHNAANERRKAEECENCKECIYTYDEFIDEGEYPTRNTKSMYIPGDEACPNPDPYDPEKKDVRHPDTTNEIFLGSRDNPKYINFNKNKCDECKKNIGESKA